MFGAIQNDHPDKALLWKSGDLSVSAAALAASATLEEFQKSGGDLSLKAMAFTVQDLQQIAARFEEFTQRVQRFVFDLASVHPAIVAATNAATNAPPLGDQSQLDLPANPPGQTAPK